MTRNVFIYAPQLRRDVIVDIYDYTGKPAVVLLMNDGQDLRDMDISSLLINMDVPVVVVGIHAGPQRLQEYGVAGIPNFQGEGAAAGNYTSFIMDDLLPALYEQQPEWKTLPLGFAGWSLGGLSALDIVWNHATEFSFAGVMSGSFWWRDKPLGEGYSDLSDRIMHRVIRNSEFKAGLHFFFECGTADELADRNNNGIIDSIDDTKDLITELLAKGYEMHTDISYLEIQGGRHHPVTWKLALEEMFSLPYFNPAPGDRR
ncbi:esterase family protein [Chitinophaga sp. Cy-1792]|uniref:alpha/beta hydrolase n=1 Tax=Chitinophaga sp. Cy-1792 TaxID=2608339 RepID=UPI00141E3CB7|nr:alpha/beta hydrolase-fold protein [Chitinophaga sp. Cy-1792]NIG53955.1 esterase [Chitinophaga sp. Cy-1792]